MKNTHSFAAAALFLLAPLATAVQAQAAPTPPSKAQMETAALRFKVMYSALAAPKIEAPVKNALFGCIYQHSMSEISAKMDQAIAANPKVKIDKTNPDQLLGVMAAVCGYKPANAPAPAGK